MRPRLRAAEVAFRYLDRPAAPQHVGGLAVFEPGTDGVDYPTLLRLIEQRIALVPRYRQRLRPVPGHVGPPVWVDDAGFDISYHVRRSALPRPGTEAELLEFCGRIQSRQLDRGRPLWEMYLIEGLADGRFALATKTHPSLVDGSDAREITQVLLDDRRDQPGVEPGPVPLWMPDPPRGSLELVAGALVAAAGHPVRLAQTARRGVADAGQVAARVGGLVENVVADVARTGRSLVAGSPPAPLRVRLSPHRRLATARTELADYRRIRAASGASVHDAILATVAGALRSWLQYREVPVQRDTVVRALVPLSLDGGTVPRIVAVPVELPVGEPDPAVRLGRISHDMATAVAARPVLGADVLVTLSGFAPPALLTRAARTVDGLAGRVYDLSVTNVPGPQQPRYLGAARMQEMFAFLPLRERKAMALGVVSYAGGVYYGCTGDRAAVPDLAVLAQQLEESVSELVHAVGGAAVLGRPR